MADDLTAAEVTRAMRHYDDVIRRGREIQRRRRTTTSVLTAVGVAIVAALVAVPLALTRESSGARVSATAGRDRVTHPNAELRPSWVTGDEQHITEVQIPAFATDTLRMPHGQWEVVDGTMHAFSVDGSPPAVIFDATRNPNSALPVAPGVSVVGMYEQMDAAALAAGGGYGVLSGSVPLADIESGARDPVFLAPQWPQVHQQAYAWPHLPAGTAIVTYVWQGTQLWQRPLDGVAGFVMARPAQFDGPLYSDWHTAPIPVMTAYDASGHVLAQVKAPRMNGDDFVISPG